MVSQAVVLDQILLHTRYTTFHTRYTAQIFAYNKDNENRIHLLEGSDVYQFLYGLDSRKYNDAKKEMQSCDSSSSEQDSKHSDSMIDKNWTHFVR